MKCPTQDPKYHIEGGRLVNASTGEPIPANEPIFIVRGKDVHALNALHSYRNLCKNEAHSQAVEARIGEFEEFAAKNSAKMKEPDTGKPQPI